jgi:hypothetical protein
LFDGTSNNFVVIRMGGTPLAQMLVTVGGVSQPNVTTANSVTANSMNTIAVRVAPNDNAIVLNNGTAGSVVSVAGGTLPVVNRLRLAKNTASVEQADNIYAIIDFYLYPPTNAELSAMVA